MAKKNESSAKMKNKKNVIDLNAGHAEIESDEILYVYGNAYKVVLNENKLHQKIIKVWSWLGLVWSFIFF